MSNEANEGTLLHAITQAEIDLTFAKSLAEMTAKQRTEDTTEDEGDGGVPPHEPYGTLHRALVQEEIDLAYARRLAETTAKARAEDKA